MTILQIGVPKSGNYWLYRILMRIIEESQDIDFKSYIRTRPIYQEALTWELSTPDQVEENVIDIEDEGCYYRISSRFREKIPSLNEYLENNTLSWTHSFVCSRSSEVVSGFAKRICIVRDPRDVCISMSRFILTPYMRTYFPTSYRDPAAFIRDDIDGQMERWARHVDGYVALSRSLGIHFIFYERLRTGFGQELRRLLRYLEIELSEEQVDRIERATSIDAMRSDSPGHVRSGDLYNWMELLPDEEIYRIAQLYGRRLEAFGYPVAKGSKGMLPRLPNARGPGSA